MVEHTSKDGETNLKASTGSEPGLRKFTLSCSRCRASKLKCDKMEPCMECVKRNIGHLCIKDERQPRAKRTKTGNSNNNDKNNNTKINALQSQELEAEETAKVLEHFVDGTPLTSAYPSALSFVTPDYPNSYWSETKNPQRQGERFALIREIVDTVPEVAIIYLLYEVFVTRCQGPLGNIVHTPTFMTQAETFCACLTLTSPEARVMALHTKFSMDQLARHLLALVLALAFHPTPSLLGWAPTPLTLRVEELRASNVHSRTWKSLALRCIQGEVSLFSGSIAGLQTAIMLLLEGQEEPSTLDVILVTAISGAQKLGLHRLGDRRLEASTSPISKFQDESSKSTEATHIRTEIGVRIWWALVMRDWARGLTLKYYTIHPLQFNTRMPLHINDDDLCPMTFKINVHGQVTERPRSEYTMLSYTVHTLEIALFARESSDLQAQGDRETSEGATMRNHLTKKYENFVAGLPSYFRLGSNVGLTSTGPDAAIPVQRWMLHQQLWSLYLKLHRGTLSAQNGRAFCQLLAQNIISTQGQIQIRCTVCNSLSTSETQFVNAAIVLLVDLLFSSKYDDADPSSVQLRRLMARDKIREAIELLRTRSGAQAFSTPQSPQADRIKASAQRSVIALEALMKLEGEESGDDQNTSGANSRQNRVGEQDGGFSSGARQPLKNKVMDIMEALQEGAETAAATMEQADSNPFTDLDMSMPLPTVTDGFQDLDVLPVLSNDSNYNLWEFLNFTPPPQSPIENDPFPATADSQNVVGSTPSMISSGMAHSLNSFGTPDFADVQ